LTALSTLDYLDRQEKAAVRADREALRDAVVQLAALDRLERGNRDRTPSSSATQPETKRPQVNIDDIVNELERLVEEQQRGSGLELPSVAVTDARPDAPPRAVEEIPAEEKRMTGASVAPALVRKAGHFGRATWIRQPDPR
jgi:hypothetical protein